MRPWCNPALLSAARAEELGLAANQIVISAKCSEVQDLIAVYRLLATRCDHALHLGLTEAGMGSKGIVASTAALGVLLQEGIGDTIRISLTPEPGGDRTREVTRGPGNSADHGASRLRAHGHRLSRLRPHHLNGVPGTGPGHPVSTSATACAIGARIIPASKPLQLAVMGCIVNGPGESKHADIGISLPGTGELPSAPVYIDGKKTTTLRGENISQQFKDIVENYVKTRWG